MTGIPRIGIVGAGIGGLAAAVALRRLGLRVEVFERTEQFARVGAGLQMAPNVTKALRPLGLLEPLLELACQPVAWRSYSAADGSMQLELPLGDEATRRYGGPYLHVHRADLHWVLAAAAGEVRMGWQVAGLDAVGDQVELSFVDGARERFDAVIGADGVHSTVREVVAGPQDPRFSGMVAYRGLVPEARLAGMAVERVAAKWWASDRHLVHYFVSAGQELNFVAPVPSTEWTQESWSAPGSVSDLLDDLADFPGPVLDMLSHTETLMRSALYDREPLRRWTDGRVTLLGDACHPMLPFMAQGAGTAIEDAVVLSRCLSEVDKDGLPDALLRYEQARRPRTAAMQAGSRGNDFLRDTRAEHDAAKGPSSAEVYQYDAWREPLLV